MRIWKLVPVDRLSVTKYRFLNSELTTFRQEMGQISELSFRQKTVRRFKTVKRTCDRLKDRFFPYYSSLSKDCLKFLSREFLANQRTVLWEYRRLQWFLRRQAVAWWDQKWRLARFQVPSKFHGSRREWLGSSKTDQQIRSSWFRKEGFDNKQERWKEWSQSRALFRGIESEMKRWVIILKQKSHFAYAKE